MNASFVKYKGGIKEYTPLRYGVLYQISMTREDDDGATYYSFANVEGEYDAKYFSSVDLQCVFTDEHVEKGRTICVLIPQVQRGDSFITFRRSLRIEEISFTLANKIHIIKHKNTYYLLIRR